MQCTNHSTIKSRKSVLLNQSSSALKVSHEVHGFHGPESDLYSDEDDHASKL